MATKSPTKPKSPNRPLDPFRRAVLRGLGVLLPPLLTVVIFLWVGKTVINYVLEPMEQAARYILVEYATDIRSIEEVPKETIQELSKVGGLFSIAGDLFVKTIDGKFIPEYVDTGVRQHLGKSAMPTGAHDIYETYIDQQYLQRQYVIPVFLGVFILALYLLGKFLAAGVGRILWGQLERLITTLPLVSNVYSSVKQVTDFMFTEPNLEATRVVAIEYPRRGIWTLAMVTGESMLDIRAAANEPVLSVLVPTSPMPFTGFTMTVRKSETIDLDITVDQALQFIVSCGVVVPPHQLAEALKNQERKLPVDATLAASSPLPAAASVASEE